ncbi:MAG: NAD-binding protein [Acidimicrobiia bacterium]|nr:NAD-binding protein [Acidimicrobiia bacterium]
MRVGFAGLGIMGGGMAKNLQAGDVPLRVWNRSPQPTKAFADLGVEVASSPADLASESDVVMLCVSDTPDVEEVVFSENGIANGLAPGSVVVDHSTISPEATAEFAGRVADQGAVWIDAPVSGGSEGAENGSLSVMAGGDADAFERVRPVMEHFSSSITHIGTEPGMGQTAKIVNQILVVVTQLGVSEAFLVAEAGGLDLEKTLRAVEGGAAGSWMLSNRWPQMMADDWRPGFTIDLQLKDLRIALDAADKSGVPTPGTALTFQMYRALQQAGNGGDGNHALVKALQAMLHPNDDG